MDVVFLWWLFGMVCITSLAFISLSQIRENKRNDRKQYEEYYRALRRNEKKPKMHFFKRKGKNRLKF